MYNNKTKIHNTKKIMNFDKGELPENYAYYYNIQYLVSKRMSTVQVQKFEQFLQKKLGWSHYSFIKKIYIKKGFDKINSDIKASEIKLISEYLEISIEDLYND